MSHGGVVSYLYDGSMEGFLTCVFESFEKKERPCAIVPQDRAAPTLFEERSIETCGEKAARVSAALSRLLGRDGERLFRLAWLCGEPEKELLLLRYLYMAAKKGPGIVRMTGHPVAGEVYRRARMVLNERMHYLGFLRFSDISGALVATIRPKHEILPLLGRHFSSRYPEERWIIFDAAHGMAMVYQPYERRILSVDAFEPQEPTEKEKAFRALWQRYYRSIAVEGRENPRCRMGHMPKRFWGEMTEMAEPALPPEREEAFRLPLGPGLPAKAREKA